MSKANELDPGLKQILDTAYNQAFNFLDLTEDSIEKAIKLKINRTCIPSFFIGSIFENIKTAYVKWFESNNDRKIEYKDYDPFLIYISERFVDTEKIILEKFETLQKYRNAS